MLSSEYAPGNALLNYSTTCIILSILMNHKVLIIYKRRPGRKFGGPKHIRGVSNHTPPRGLHSLNARDLTSCYEFLAMVSFSSHTPLAIIAFSGRDNYIFHLVRQSEGLVLPLFHYITFLGLKISL